MTGVACDSLCQLCGRARRSQSVIQEVVRREEPIVRIRVSQIHATVLSPPRVNNVQIASLAKKNAHRFRKADKSEARLRTLET